MKVLLLLSFNNWCGSEHISVIVSINVDTVLRKHSILWCLFYFRFPGLDCVFKFKRASIWTRTCSLEACLLIVKMKWKNLENRRLCRNDKHQETSILSCLCAILELSKVSICCVFLRLWLSVYLFVCLRVCLFCSNRQSSRRVTNRWRKRYVYHLSFFFNLCNWIFLDTIINRLLKWTQSFALMVVSGRLMIIEDLDVHNCLLIADFNSFRMRFGYPQARQ